MSMQQSSIQIWIFAPWRPTFGENWVEQILGDIVLPTVDEYSAQIDAVWMTRYIDSMSKEAYEGLGELFLKRQQDGNEYWRHVKLRFLLNGDIRPFKSRLETYMQEVQCIAPRGWEDFDYVGDLGRDRFIEADAVATERTQRALLVFRFMDATTRLMLDAIQKNDQGEWHFELNDDEQNPEGSFFQSMHHLFCNATGVPTFVDVVFPQAGIHAHVPVKF